ncbi:MAG: Ig-like domain repeat protein, partial [Thermoguttaceae bacterium]
MIGDNTDSTIASLCCTFASGIRKLAGRCGCLQGASLKRDRHVHRRLLRIEPLEVRTLLSTYTVTNTADSGPGSLRQAITDANANLGTDTIAFSIASAGVQTISPTTLFPSISGTVILDATTQPGYAGTPLIEISGGGTLSQGFKLTSSSSGSTVEGFTINRFASYGILEQGSGNLITKNWIGTDKTGLAAAANGYAIQLTGNSNNIVNNVLSGNSTGGVYINGVTGTIVTGNYIGLNYLGTATIANHYGLRVSSCTGTIIGGLSSADRNIISGSTSNGIYMTGGSSNTIENNYIGTDYTGTIGFGNAGSNVSISSSDNNVIGAPGAGNVIDASGGQGIKIVGATGTLIQGNYVGVNAAGTGPLGNSADAVWLNNAVNTTVGGTTTGAGNILANSLFVTVSFNGVKITGTSTGNAVLGNSIYGNSGLGIDLGGDGLTANNGTTNASLPNNDMDFPVIVHAWLNGDALTVSGYVGSAPNQSTFANARVEFFKSDNDPSGYGQGSKYLNYLPTDANGNFSGTITVSGLAKGDKITATATDAGNNTSEFGPNIVTAGITVTPVSGLTTTEAGGTAHFTVVLDSQPTADVTIGISSSNLTEGTVSVPSLTFTTDNWNLAQSVTVTGVDNHFVDVDTGYTILTAAAVSADANYNDLDPSDVSITTTDNDTYNTIYVDTNSDISDGDTTSIAALYANKGLDGMISLREAITAADNTANGPGGPDRIYFNISGGGVHTISPASALPFILDTTILDATTQTGYNGTPLIEINGAASEGTALKLSGISGGSTIKGFTINRCTDYGVWIQSDGNTISNNWVGLDYTGTTASANRYGIYISSSTNNIVHNVLSGNSDGIYFGNVADNNIIAANFVGTNPAGTAAIGNGYGVRIKTGTGNTIGGTTAADRNIISGNTNNAIYISSAGNTVIGNYVGTDYTGTAAIHNSGGYSILVSNANDNVIGAPNAGNVIAAGVAGIMINTATGTKIQGNYIGLNAAGTAALSNSDRGIYLKSSSNTLIGGTDAADRNVISGNLDHAIHINSSSNSNTVEGNYIGTDKTGNVAIGNTGSSICIDAGSNNNVIGAPGAGNVIVAGSDQGIKIDGVSGTVIQGNFIGVGANGTTPLGNTGDAVWLNNATSTTIGGTTTGMGNIIANSLSGIVGHNGVEINGTSTGVAIRGDSIYGNAGLGIDLGGGGVTANNGTKNASLPNYDMDFPVIVHAWLSGNSLTLSGYVGSAPNQSIFANAVVEFFQSDNSPSGYGQGRKSLGCLTTDANGNFSGTLTVNGVAKGDKITATATDAGNNTSEFGPNIITAGITVTPVSGLTTTEAGGTAQFSVVLDSQPTADVVIGISPSNITEGTVSVPSLTFTTDNWNTAQTVTVTGVDDLAADGDIAYSIITAPAASADLNYNGLDASDVSLTNIDNDTTTSVASDHPAGSVYGQTIYLTATVSASLGAGTPTGTVQFQIDGNNFGSAILLHNGTASIAVNSLRAGSHNVTATYASDNTPTIQNSQTVS